MQKNTTVFLALIYSLLFAAAVCFFFYGDHVQYITYPYLVGLLFMLPFIYAAIFLKRKNEGGLLGGRPAFKEGLKFVVIATLFMALFQVLFFEFSFREYKINFMQTMGPQILKEQIAAGKMKMDEADIPKMIAADIEGVTVFKEITAVVFKNLFFGTFASVVSAIILKRKA